MKKQIISKDVSAKEFSGNLRRRRFILPLLLGIAGLIMIIVFAPMTTHLNSGTVAGLLAVCAAVIWFFAEMNREIYRIGGQMPWPMDIFFPSYPIVEDQTKLHTQLHEFRDAFSEFLGADRIRENSALQNHASQILWHTLALQKRRLMKFGLALELKAERRAYSSPDRCVRSKRFFDGKYNVTDVYEEIDATKTWSGGGKMIHSFRSREVAHYTLLSAREVGGGKVSCPNCGNNATRENLIDGCDYCGTKFTVEDLNNRVAGFGFRPDFEVSESKRDAVKELLYPWHMLLWIMPLFLFGFLLSFVYLWGEYNIILLFFGALFSGALLGLTGYCIGKYSLFIAVPLYIAFTAGWKSQNRKLMVREKGEKEAEERMSKIVRGFDPLFSLQSFFGGVQNKLFAIHFAENPIQVNAFSECDIRPFLPRYGNVVDIDVQSLSMDSYEVQNGWQIAWAGARLQLHELRGGKIFGREENVRMQLVKSAACKTQAVCGASVLKCRGCGASLSIMEGKVCSFCGNVLDMKQFDWVITQYMPV